LPAWASTLRIKWTRHLCQVAHSTLLTAALMPSNASEITRHDPLQVCALFNFVARIAPRVHDSYAGDSLGTARLHQRRLHDEERIGWVNAVFTDPSGSTWSSCVNVTARLLRS